VKLAINKNLPVGYSLNAGDRAVNWWDTSWA